MIPVLIDCDTGIDDALALIYLAALHHERKIAIVGATTTAGNVDVHQTALNTQWILSQCGLPDIPVRPGQKQPKNVPLVTTPETHGEFGLGYLPSPPQQTFNTQWRELWTQATQIGPTLRIIVTGPATNLAAYGPVDNCTLMGGAYLYQGNTTPTAEWNSWVDPHAAKQVFAEAQSPINVCPLNVTERFTLDPDSLAAIMDALGAVSISKYLPEMLRFYFEFHESQGQGYLAQIHDLLTCMIAIGAIEYRAHLTTIDVEADSELMRGTTVADYRNHWDRPVNAFLVGNADIAAAHAEFLRAIRILG